MNIVIIDESPNRNDYSKYFPFKFDHFHMSSVSVKKLLKKDIDLDIDLDLYDLVILIGANPSKHYAGITNSMAMAGHLVDDKFVALQNPGMLIFKPEIKPDFEKAVKSIIEYANGGKSSVIKVQYRLIDNEEDLNNYLLILESNPQGNPIAMDTEGTALYPRDGYVLGISISNQLHTGVYILTDILTDHHIARLQKIIDTNIIVFHNMKYDRKMMSYHLKLDFSKADCHDTMLMKYVLDENSSHGLKNLALKFSPYGDYDAELDEFIKDYCKKHGLKKEEFTFDLIPSDIIVKYACTDAACTYLLYAKFIDAIEKNSKLNYVYTNLLLKGTAFLEDIEEVGIPISRERMAAASNYLNTLVEEKTTELYNYSEVHLLEKAQGDRFNPNSVVQLRKLFFDLLDLDIPDKKTATGAISTDAEVLEDLSSFHPLPKTILDIRRATKIKNTYIDKIIVELDADDRIRTNFNLVFTTSGRLSSSGKFNAQQIVRDDPIVKGCIVAPKGYKIVSQDLVTGEMYYAAVLSGDKNLQKVFLTKGDFHSSIAKMVFDLPCPVEDVKKLYPELRQAAKAISFGIKV